MRKGIRVLRRTASILAAGAILSACVASIAFGTTPADHQERQARPIPLGVSGGSIDDSDGPFCCGGTLGSLVLDGSATLYILSNNHVLGRANRAVAGEDTVQPGLIEVGCREITDDAVADFAEYIPIDFDGTNLVDAAISGIRAGAVDTSGTILDIGPPATQTLEAFVGLGVQKSGRTTGHTWGQVSAVDVTVNVSIPTKCGVGRPQVATFTDQVRITPGTFSDSGDSGSLVLEDVATNPRAVGLLFAGSSTSTLANRIQNVLGASWSAGPLSMAGAPAAVCGDGTCDPGEDSCNCPSDCGSPPASETLCSDGADNDCDGTVDCDDADCGGDAACPSCGDGLCNGVEDSCSCPADCGTPDASETICSDGADNDCDGTVDCDDTDCASDPACDTSGCGNGTCEGNGEDCLTCPSDCRCAGPGCSACCGDGVCAGPGENPSNCPVDCGGSTGASEGSSALEHAARIKATHSDRLLAIPGVIGHGLTIGRDGTPVIEIYLEAENPSARGQIPDRLEDVPTRLLVTGAFVAY